MNETSDLIPSSVLLAIIQNQINNGVDELKVDIADVNNTTETPAVAGNVWTSTESGAGWREPTVGKAVAFELLVSQELAEKVDAVSFEFGKAVNEIYMLCQSPKVTAISGCQWKNQDGNQVGSWTSNVLSSSGTRYVMTHFYSIDGVLRICEVRYGSNNQALGTTNTGYFDYYDGISKLMGTYAKGFMAGTTFTVWGR